VTKLVCLRNVGSFSLYLVIHEAGAQLLVTVDTDWFRVIGASLVDNGKIRQTYKLAQNLLKRGFFNKENF
jgi:hypothetical protein